MTFSSDNSDASDIEMPMQPRRTITHKRSKTALAGSRQRSFTIAAPEEKQIQRTKSVSRRNVDENAPLHKAVVETIDLDLRRNVQSPINDDFEHDFKNLSMNRRGRHRRFHSQAPSRMSEYSHAEAPERPERPDVSLLRRKTAAQLPRSFKNSETGDVHIKMDGDSNNSSDSDGDSSDGEYDDETENLEVPPPPPPANAKLDIKTQLGSISPSNYIEMSNFSMRSEDGRRLLSQMKTVPTMHQTRPPTMTGKNQRTIQEMMEWDSEDDDRDDSLSILDEAKAEETAANAARPREQPNETKWEFIARWLWKFMKTMMFLSLFLVPGIMCYYFRISYYGEILFACALISVAIIGAFLSDMAVMLAIIAVTNTPVLGKHFVFYVSKLRSPMLWSLTTVFVIITYKLLLQVGVLQDSKFLTQANNYLDPLITCAVVTAITFLVKGLAVRYMAIGFQRAAFYRRIKKSLLEEYVLNCLLNRKPKKHAVESLAKTLKNYLKLKSGGDRLSIITKQQNPTMKVVKDKRKQHPSYDEQEDGKQGIAGWFDFDLNDDSVFDAIQVQESELLDREPISNHKLAVFVEFIKSTELLYTKGLYKRCIMRMHEKEQFKEDLPTITYEHGEEHLDMSNAKASRLLAHAIWLRLNPKGDTVSAENFVQFMNPEMAAVGFSLFVGNWNGVIKETDIFTTLLSIARERRALKTALYDGESSVDRLDSAISGTCAMILFVFYFIIFGYNAQQVLTTLSSFLLAVAFAVGSSAKALLESIIFIFGRHPFDIGDRVVIDKVVYTVAKVGLLTSELRRYDNSIVYFSNSELSSKPILNLRRSPDQVDLIKMQVSFYTKKRQLKMFESKLASFMSKHTYHYHPKFEVEYQDLENSNRMNIRIWVTHRSNFQNMKRYRERRGRLILFIKKACENLGIEYELPAQRVISDTYGWDVTGSYQPGENTVFDLPQTSDVQSQPRGDPSPNLSATKTVIHAPSGGLFLSKSGGYGLNPPAAEHDYEYDTLNAARSPIAQKTMADIDGMRYNDGLFRENTPYDPVASFIDEQSLAELKEREANALAINERRARMRKNADPKSGN